MKRLLAIGLLVVSCACTSDRELVSGALATRHYEAGRCALDCCQPKTGVWDAAAGKQVDCVPRPDAPATCAAWKKSLNALVDEVDLANDAQTYGKLPKNARTRLKALDAEAQREGKP